MLCKMIDVISTWKGSAILASLSVDSFQTNKYTKSISEMIDLISQAAAEFQLKLHHKEPLNMDRIGNRENIA